MVFDPVPPEKLQAKAGSARRKLWELCPIAACPVTGVCLHFHEVQKMARKVGLQVDGCSEYDVHGLVLQECSKRSPLAELVQRELDHRFAQSIKQAQGIKTTEALTHWWEEACQGADWAGEFWAVLTHPRCSSDLEQIVLGKVHMLQHQAGIAARTDALHRNGLLAENYRLSQDLTATQQRLHTQAREHAALVSSLQADCLSLRANIIRAEAERDLALTQWRELKDIEPSAFSRQRLVDDNQRLQAHNARLLIRAQRREVQATGQSVVKASRGLVHADHGTDEPVKASTLLIDLKDRQVLCVGGRTSSISVYREVIEDRGASFAHHDGGEEDKASRLISQLQAADVVICQVGCISHDAYWRVKEHCKRTGKLCLFVEMSGRSALVRALGPKVASDSVVVMDTVGEHSQTEKTMPLRQ
jgi:hypothetical protein